MSHALFTVSVAGLEEGSHDELAAKFVVEKENGLRAKANSPLLPVETFDDLKASYVLFLESLVQQVHESYISEQATEQAKVDLLLVRWLQASEAERNAALTALPEATEH